MRRILSMSLVILFVSATLPVQGFAADCTKAETVGKDVWTNYVKWAIAAGCVGGVTATTGSISVDQMKACYAAAATIASILDGAQEYWNSMVGTSSWMTIGPRDLVPGEWETGTLWSTSGRLFITIAAVPSGSKVSVTETGGKGKTAVSVCTVTDSGASNIKEFIFNDSSSAKSNTSESMSVTTSKNAVIAIHLDGKSVSNSFSYKVKVTPAY